MKKILLFSATLLIAAASTSELHAQSTFTADLELIFRDTVRNFIIEPGDSTDIGFAVVNHGPDDVDTTGYVLYSMTGVPPSFSLIVQSDDGELIPIPAGDTVLSRGVRFSNTPASDTGDVIIDYCYFLRTTEDPDNFIDDSNQTNDTICFTVTYKKSNTPIGIADIDVESIPLKITPNPVSDIVSIPVKAFQYKQAMLTIYSLEGRVAYRQQSDKWDKVEVNVRTWPKGMYMVEVQAGTLKQRGKFVVQ